jgi:phosphoglucomutase
MTVSPLAGKPAPKELLIDPARLEREFYTRALDLTDPAQLVSFGTSGHRGSPLRGSFNEAHIVPTQAMWTAGACRAAPSSAATRMRYPPAQRTAIQSSSPAVSDCRSERERIHAGTGNLARVPANRGRTDRLTQTGRRHAVAQPAGGWRLQVQPPNSEPGYRPTGWIQRRANELLREGNRS